MWQRIKDILKDLKSYVGLVVGLFGVLNNYLHLFMPLAPSLRLRANVFVVLIPAIAIGITIARVHDKAGPFEELGAQGGRNMGGLRVSCLGRVRPHCGLSGKSLFEPIGFSVVRR